MSDDIARFPLKCNCTTSSSSLLFFVLFFFDAMECNCRTMIEG